MTHFPSKLTRARLALEKTQSEVAAHLGISRVAYGFYEKGMGEPTLAMAICITFLKVTSVKDGAF